MKRNGVRIWDWITVGSGEVLCAREGITTDGEK